MYTTTVKVRKLFKGKRATIILLTPLIWAFLTLTSFIIGVKVTPLALIAMILLFIAVIPMIIILMKASEPFKGPNSFETQEVTFQVFDGELYLDNLKLDVDWDDVDGSLYLQNTSVIVHPKYKTKTYVTKFSGFVEQPYANDFLNFLKSHNVKIIDANSGLDT